MPRTISQQNLDLDEPAHLGPGSVSDGVSGNGQVTAEGGASASGQGSVSVSGNASTTGEVLTLSGSVTCSGSANYSVPTDDGYSYAFGGGGGTGVFKAGFSLASSGPLANAVVHLSLSGGSDDADGPPVLAILRYTSGPSTVVAIEGDGTWDGILVLPGSYELELRASGNARAASGSGEPLSGNDSFSAFGSVNCTVSVQ
jgi:hypothetical protein